MNHAPILSEATTRPNIYADTDALGSSSDILTKPALAKRIGVTDRTITEWQRERGLPVIRVGSTVRYHWPTCLAWMLSFQAGGEQAKKKKDAGEGPTRPTSNSSRIPTDQDQETKHDRT